MKTKLGIVLMAIGVLLVAGALGLFLRNQQEQQLARESVDHLMPRMAEVILERQRKDLSLLGEPNGNADSADAAEQVPPEQIYLPVSVTEPPKTRMPVVLLGDQEYIGFIGFPGKGLELPVMADWSYPQLKNAPCRFAGDMYTDDLVIMAHNYDQHFGVLHELRTGDRITVTDMDGDTVQYVVVALDVLPSTAVEEMTAGEYDLTLFTCTYGGQSRVTVRCDRVE